MHTSHVRKVPPTGIAAAVQSAMKTALTQRSSSCIHARYSNRRRQRTPVARFRCVHITPLVIAPTVQLERVLRTVYRGNTRLSPGSSRHELRMYASHKNGLENMVTCYIRQFSGQNSCGPKRSFQLRFGVNWGADTKLVRGAGMSVLGRACCL